MNNIKEIILKEIDRANTQYKDLRELRDNLPDTFTTNHCYNRMSGKLEGINLIIGNLQQTLQELEL